MYMIYLCIAILFVIISGFVSSDWSTTIHKGDHYCYSPSMRLSQCLYVCIITIHQQIYHICAYIYLLINIITIITVLIIIIIIIVIIIIIIITIISDP